MNTSEISKISLMKLDIYGLDYSLEIERDVRDCLSEVGLYVVVTGERSVAAGCPLEYQLMCFIRDSIASALVYDLFEFAVGKVAKAFRNAGKSDVPGTRISMITSGCELVLSVKASAGVDPASVPYEDLITKMREFVTVEAQKGFPVKRVEAPCELIEEDGHFTKLYQGVGNFYLWRVSYKDGERWPVAVFDAANSCFVDLVR